MYRYFLLFFLIIILSAFSADFASAQEFDEDGFLIIKANPDLPLALVTLTRTRPEFVSMGIEKDATEISTAFQRSVIAPAEIELEPKIIEELDTMLARERM